MPTPRSTRRPVISPLPFSEWIAGGARVAGTRRPRGWMTVTPVRHVLALDQRGVADLDAGHVRDRVIGSGPPVERDVYPARAPAACRAGSQDERRSRAKGDECGCGCALICTSMKRPAPPPSPARGRGPPLGRLPGRPAGGRPRRPARARPRGPRRFLAMARSSRELHRPWAIRPSAPTSSTSCWPLRARRLRLPPRHRRRHGRDRRRLHHLPDRARLVPVRLPRLLRHGRHARQGLMREASEQVLDHAFGPLGCTASRRTSSPATRRRSRWPAAPASASRASRRATC